MNYLKYMELNTNTLLVEWPEVIDTFVLKEILAIQEAVERVYAYQIIECFPAYRSLAICFKESQIQSMELVQFIDDLENQEVSTTPIQCWTLPVCYDQVVAMDLSTLALSKKMSIEEVIQAHSEPLYTVCFFGFLPGFMYLSGLPKKLHTRRKKTPDTKIPVGSVAIGGQQTGIYPSSSPGGWHVIGNCPISLFNAQNNPPCFIQPGDQVRFEAVNIQDFGKIKEQIEAGTYQIQKQWVN